MQHEGQSPVHVRCEGDWAGSGYWESYIDENGTEWLDGQAGLFRYVDGAWTFLGRGSWCDDPAVPASVWDGTCNVD